MARLRQAPRNFKIIPCGGADAWQEALIIGSLALGVVSG